MRPLHSNPFHFFSRTLALFVFFLADLLMLPLHANAQQIPTHLLFIGNSYTYGNDPQALNQQTAAMLQELLPPQTTTHQERIAYGGYLWEQHLADLQNTQTIKPFRQLLLESQDPLHRWQWVIFQEQSQIPGIPETDPYAQRSTNAIQQLAAIAHSRNARSILLMTWGRRDGDPQNKAIFPDFKAMQARLRDGYLRYRNRASTAQNTVYIAPAGIAWEILYDTIKRDGKDPLLPESLWYRLYDGDGSHPSLLGTFLAAATLTASLTGRDPRSLTYNPTPNIPEIERKQLLQTAYQAVLQNTLPIPFPWTQTTHENTPEKNTENIAEPISPDASTESTPSERIPDPNTNESNTNETSTEPLPPEPSTEIATSTEPLPPDITIQDALPSEQKNPTPQGCCTIHATPSLDLAILILLAFGLIFLRRRPHKSGTR